MRSRKSPLLLFSGAAVVLLAGPAFAATTSTMPIYTSTTRLRATTTTRPSMTTTTIGAPVIGSCPSITACEAALMAALPNPTTGATAKEKRLARILVRLTTHASSELDRATAASTAQKARLFRKANHTLARLRTLADKAETKGKLSVPVGPIDADAASLMSLAH